MHHTQDSRATPQSMKPTSAPYPARHNYTESTHSHNQSFHSRQRTNHHTLCFSLLSISSTESSQHSGQYVHELSVASNCYVSPLDYNDSPRTEGYNTHDHLPYIYGGLSTFYCPPSALLLPLPLRVLTQY
ncbi:hypothetical protein BDD12DRAFT_826382 [Trichophaea hybrida]|nr:hypothetical protein BDD12DRAFT_826382 [Trichophaea hybrida]